MQRLEKFIQEKMTATHLPSVSGAAMLRGEVVWARGFGFRDLARGLPASERTLYCIASMTKSFTCLAIMQLAEAGKLAVDDAVGQHIPFDLQVKGEPVRLWHLMTHSAGIPALAYAENMIRGLTGGTDTWLPIASYQDMITFMGDAAAWATHRPGERWYYLNEGYQLLGYVIQEVSGLTYQEYITRHILEPLGMARSFFAQAQVDADGDAATPYVVADSGERIPSVYPYGALGADGGLVSNAQDLLRYLAMHMAGGELDGVRLLSAQGIAAMQQGRIPRPEEGTPFGAATYGYGFGVLPDFYGRRLISHSGSVGTATGYLGFLPEEQTGIVLLINGSGYTPSNLGLYGLADLLGQDPESLPHVVRDRRLAELTGTYETYRGSTRFEIKRSGDLLTGITRTRYTEVASTIIPEELGAERRTFTLLQDGVRYPIVFTVTPGPDAPQVDLIWERYRLRRVGP